LNKLNDLSRHASWVFTCDYNFLVHVARFLVFLKQNNAAMYNFDNQPVEN